ncbi:acyloxyacyl hydrolase [Onishia taeanensis]
MLPTTGVPHDVMSLRWLLIFTALLLAPRLSYSTDLNIQSLALRARVSENTLLGQQAPEAFEEYDVSVNVGLPWQRYGPSSWGVDTRLMASAGLLRGAGKEALVVSLIPELTLGSDDGRFTLDLGAGGALFGRHRFGTQDYGGPFQFALTLGVSVPFYDKLGIGYRFLHYSDAGVNGADTTGADFHMIELGYRLR